MTIDDNGKQIQKVIWQGVDGDETLRTEGKRTLRFSATHHGDHDEFWVEEYLDARQVAIHNCRYIASIIWKEG